MRIEQSTTAIARPVATAIVREVKAVLSFACDTCLHSLLIVRMPMTMPSYACVPTSSCMSHAKQVGEQRHACGNALGRLGGSHPSRSLNEPTGIGKSVEET